MTVSLMCLIVSGATRGIATIALNVVAVVLCLYAMRLAWPAPRRGARDGADDLDD